jgi:hypothetical protein
MPGEEAVDSGHTAGEVELAVELAGGAEGEASRELALEEPGKILPRDAKSELEEDALHEEAGVGAG